MLLPQVDFNETTIMVTEPFFNFPSVGEAINEVIFEEYQFQALYRTQGKFYVNSFCTNKLTTCSLDNPRDIL